MSERSGDDVPRDPWGNPLPPEDRAPVNPRPDDYPPPFPSDPPGGAPTGNGGAGGPGATGIWPPAPPSGSTAPPSSTPPASAPPTEAPPARAPEGNPAWPGRPTPPPSGGDPAWPGASDRTWAGGPPSAPPGTAPGWGGPGVPAQQGHPAPPPGWGPAPWAPPRNDGMAVGALVCSIVGLLCLGIVLEPVAIVLGVVARRRIRDSHGTLKGDGMALAAIVVGTIGLVLAVVGLIILIRNPDALNDFFDRLTTTTADGGG